MAAGDTGAQPAGGQAVVRHTACGQGFRSVGAFLVHSCTAPAARREA